MLSGETMLQVPDTNAEVMSAQMFKREVQRGGPFHECVHRYSQGLLMLMMQSTGCMALHPVQERCCRWPLMTHDRVRQDEFHLSHEFLAMMLGSTRPTVTIVAGTLQKAGLIKYTHGRITILDRQSLEAASCECYATVKGHFDRLVFSASKTVRYPTVFARPIAVAFLVRSRIARSAAVHTPVPVVLIVEDDEDSREMYTVALSAMGFQPIAAANADEAFARACDSHPDAIVADVTLCDGSGLDLTRRLREDMRTKEANIIVLSGHAVQQAATSAGCDRFLLKPCLPDALADEIHDLLDARR
jgi:CheY-like chemotaxis protein